jgi:tol-pal system protein YbgF
MRSTKRLLTLAVMVPVLVAWGWAVPAWAQRSNRQLDAMNQQLAAMAGRWDRHQTQMEEKLAKIEKIVSQIQINQADLMLRIDELTRTVAASDGRSQETLSAMEDMRRRMDNLSNRMDLLAKVLAGDKLPVEDTADSPDVVFSQAYDDYLKEKYDLAVEGFRSFLTAFPEHASAPEAQYWVGECFYSQGRFNEAIVEFRKVLLDFPTSPKAGDALLKIGLAQYSQRNFEDAREIFEEVVDKYRGTPLSRLAEERLKLLEKKDQ